jgi:hypothetical protein
MSSCWLPSSPLPLPPFLTLSLPHPSFLPPPRFPPFTLMYCNYTCYLLHDWVTKICVTIIQNVVRQRELFYYSGFKCVCKTAEGELKVSWHPRHELSMLMASSLWVANTHVILVMSCQRSWHPRHELSRLMAISSWVVNAHGILEMKVQPKWHPRHEKSTLMVSSSWIVYIHGIFFMCCQHSWRPWHRYVMSTLMSLKCHLTSSWPWVVNAHGILVMSCQRSWHPCHELLTLMASP